MLSLGLISGVIGVGEFHLLFSVLYNKSDIAAQTVLALTDSMQANNVALRGEIDLFSEQNNQLRGQVESFTEQNNQLRGQVESFTEQNNQLRGQVESFTEQNAKFEKSLKMQQDISLKMASVATNISESSEEMLNLKEGLKKVSNRLEKMFSDDLERLENDLERLEDDLKRMQELNNEAEKINKESNAQIKKLGEIVLAVQKMHKQEQQKRKHVVSVLKDRNVRDSRNSRPDESFLDYLNGIDPDIMNKFVRRIRTEFRCKKFRDAVNRRIEVFKSHRKQPLNTEH